MTQASTIWSLGIDPGFIETGLVLRRSAEPDEVLAFATFKEHSVRLPGFIRAIALADAICEKANEWREYFDIHILDTCIE